MLSKEVFLFIAFIFTSAFCTLTNASTENDLPIYSHHWYGRLPYYKDEDKRSYKILIHNLFTVRFNLKTQLADWVAYKLTPHLVWGYLKERRQWQIDPLLKKEESLEDKDYRGASQFHYDRGHFAPLGSFKGSALAYEVQYLTNVVPQKRELNRGIWKRLEEKIRSYVKKGYEVKVLTGSIYHTSKPLPPWNLKKIKTIPTEFWKVIFKREGA